ncbi:MAG: pilus assembly protein N-terminal domain-containing protein [Methylococcales bacterium]|nr:pilus assembly protein N-terminal domain-containing protein [Methylococcales bacterium]MDD5633003.1 pilus assembly protein N-terminal domain-containing protein [Methylococcales bacterium]
MLNINPSKLLKTVSMLLLGYTLQAGAEITTSAESRHLVYQVPMNKSLLINLDRSIAKTVLGNPAIADITLLAPRQLLLRGTNIGGTNATLWDGNNHVAMVVEVEVTHNLNGIKEALHRVMPKEPIQVRNADRCVILSGEVSSLVNMDYAMKIASGFVSSQGGGGGYGASSGCGFVSGGGGGGGSSAGGNQNIINMMHVGGEQQVILEVKVAEVSRTLARALSLNARASSTTQQSGTFLWTVLAGAAGAFSGAYVAGDTLFNWSLDFSRNTDLATILAEPNLTTLSGKKASFLSGGEFPYTACVAGQGNTGIVPCTVNFKNFGVGVEFTPVVLDSNRINLTTHVSVSQLDNTANEVVTQGLTNTIIGTNPISINLQPVPSLNLREAFSTIELSDGQTMSIAGLISVNQNNTQSQTPGLADIPGLGALFNNRTSRKDKKELVILVTPHLAKPVPPEQIILPTDYYVAPDDIEFYLLGRMEARRKPINTAQAPVFDPSSGGTTGRFGHQIYDGDSP